MSHPQQPAQAVPAAEPRPAVSLGRRVAVAAAVGLMASACAPQVQTRRPTVLKFWAMGSEGEIVKALVPDFERQHPDIKVQVQQLPWSAAHEKLLTAYAGDATPDVAQMGNTWIPEMAALNALEPLDRWLAGDAGRVPVEDYFAGIWNTNRVEGRTLGLPWYVDTRLLYYRRDLLAQAGFARPPVSWAEWLQQMRAIRDAAVPGRHALYLPLNEFDPLLALALQQDEPLLREGGRYGNFRGAGFRRSLAFYAGLFRERLAPQQGSVQIANVWNEFGRGSMSFYISGPWNIGEFKRRLPAAQQDGWMTAPLPGPTGPGASTAGGSSLVVFRASRNKAAAWTWISYLSQPEQQRRFHALSGNLPPRRSTWAHPALAADVHAQAFREQLERVRPSPAVPEWERIVQEMQLVAARLVHGRLDLDGATRELDARVDGFLEKRRWMLERAARRVRAGSGADA